LDWDFALTFIQRMLLVLVLILPFEIRDMQWDDKGLRTLPQVLGVKVTRRLGMGLSVIFFLLTFLKDELHQPEIVLRLILSVALIFALGSNKRLQSRYFVMFWVEAIPVFWFCLFWCAESYF